MEKMYDRLNNICEIARIGMMFLDGDKLENVMQDRISVCQDDINYNSHIFNELKITLMKIEKINPALHLSTVLWQPRPDNSDMVVPVIIGSKLCSGASESSWSGAAFGFWMIQPINEFMRKTFVTGVASSVEWSNGYTSHYFAMKNSDEDIIGILEIQQPNL